MVRRAERIADFCRRAATYDELQRFLPFREPGRPSRMWRRIGARLTPLQHDVYGVVRRACWLRDENGVQRPGAFISHRETAEIVGCDKTTVARAVARLVELDVLRIIGPVYAPSAELLSALQRMNYRYNRAQDRNGYELGNAALDPHGQEVKKRRPKPKPRPVETQDKKQCKTPSLPNPEKQGRDFVSPLASENASGGVVAQTQQAVAASPHSGSGSLREDDAPRGCSAEEGSGQVRASAVPDEAPDDALSVHQLAQALGLDEAWVSRLGSEASP
jgi:hypothetical protein